MLLYCASWWDVGVPRKPLSAEHNIQPLVTNVRCGFFQGLYRCLVISTSHCICMMPVSVWVLRGIVTNDEHSGSTPSSVKGTDREPWKKNRWKKNSASCLLCEFSLHANGQNDHSALLHNIEPHRTSCWMNANYQQLAWLLPNLFIHIFN